MVCTTFEQVPWNYTKTPRFPSQVISAGLLPKDPPLHQNAVLDLLEQFGTSF